MNPILPSKNKKAKIPKTMPNSFRMAPPDSTNKILTNLVTEFKALTKISTSIPPAMKRSPHAIAKNPNASKCTATALPKVFFYLFQVISAVKHANALDVKIIKIQIDKKNLILGMTRK